MLIAKTLLVVLAIILLGIFFYAAYEPRNRGKVENEEK